MWTLGLLSPFFDNQNKDGLNRELREALRARDAWGGLWDISFDQCEMALLLDDMFRNAALTCCSIPWGASRSSRTAIRYRSSNVT
ncbi:MAG: hypothetical protein V8T86_14070 [Victivallis sp.]